MSRNGKRDSYELDTTGLPPLPKGWCWTTLATVADIEGGITKDQKRPRTSTMREVPYLRVANVQRGYLDLDEIKTILAEEKEVEALRLREGDVLFTEGGDRDKLGRGWIWNGEIADCIHQNHIFRARPELSVVVPKFVSFHGNHFGQKWFVRTGKQTTNLASINKGVLSRFPVPVAPLNEQRHIVAKIDELFSDLDAGVAALERVRANLKRYRAAVLKAAVEGRLTEEWRKKNRRKETGQQLLDRILRQRRRKWEEDQLAAFAKAGKTPPPKWKDKYKEPTSVEGTNLPALPEGWCWASVEQVGNVQLGRQRSPKNRSKDYPTKYIRAANITEQGLDLTDVLDMEFAPHELPSYRLMAGDIILSEASGSPDQVGKPAVWEDEIADCCFQNTVIRLRPCTLDSKYLLAVFRYFYWNKIFARVATGVGINHLSAAKFARMVVPIAPLEEQRYIVEEVERRFSILEESQAQIEANRKRSICLRQAILKQAFEGKLVPQDPNDEPATIMLERLQADPSAGQSNGSRPSPKRPRARRERLRHEHGSADR